MLRTRYLRITLFFARIITSIIFWDLFLARFGLRGLAVRTRPKRLKRAAAAFRKLAIQMGGVMIKVGQFMSTRVDILPTEIIAELAGLQDEVPPVPFNEILKVAEAEFEAPLVEMFAAFETSPLAAASLGQVHRARLHPQDYEAHLEDSAIRSDAADFDVVVKIQRPRIEEIINTDLAALNTVGRWLQRYRPIRKRADVPALLEEFSRILHEEIDYIAEGNNAETFAENFEGESGVRVPRVIWSHTTRRALTLENVFAIKITDYDAITAAGIDREEVAVRLLDTYLKQIFEDGFFHADPHPGNLFVQPLVQADSEGFFEHPEWRLTFVDFGMTGHVSGNMLAGLREALIGVGTQDTSRVIKAYQIMDVLLPGADLELIEKAEAKLFDRFWGKSMSELTAIEFDEVKEFAKEFSSLLFDMPFQMPQNLIFLARCVAILAGMCTGLDPHFNLWEHLVPYTKKLIAEEAGDVPFWINELGTLVKALIAAPRRIDAIITKMERGELAVRTPDIDRQTERLQASIGQATQAVIFAGLLIAGAQLYTNGEPVMGGILLGGAAVQLIWLLARKRQ